MSTPEHYPTPHLLGEVDYSGAHRFAPDGDTVHLLRPVLLVNGVATPPVEGKFAVWVTGANKARIIQVKQTAQQVVVVEDDGWSSPTPAEETAHSMQAHR